MALALVHCSIEADQGGTLYARARVSWEGGKSCSVVYGSARSSGCEAHDPSATATIRVLYIYSVIM